MIYLDNAATTMHKPDVVTEAVVKALSTLGNAGRGAADASLQAAGIIYDTRRRLTELFHAENPARIAFTMNSTESLNIAVKGVLRPGDHVITTELEHNSVLRPLYEMQQKGVELSFVKSDPLGRVRTEEFEERIQSNTRAIVCTHASNLTGNVVDIERIGKIARKYHLLFVVDASQTAGVFPIDVRKMNIDILCFTGHKGLLGPQGTGGIYVREGVTVRPLLSGGSGIMSYSKTHPTRMPEALEAGTLNAHGIAGLHAAVGYLLEKGIRQIREEEQELMWRFYRGIKEIPEIQIYGDFSTRERCAVVTLNLSDYDSSEVSDALFTDYGIATRPGAHCAPLMHQALGTEKQGSVRFSFSHFNTKEEIDTAIRALWKLAE